MGFSVEKKMRETEREKKANDLGSKILSSSNMVHGHKHRNRKTKSYSIFLFSKSCNLISKVEPTQYSILRFLRQFVQISYFTKVLNHLYNVCPNERNCVSLSNEFRAKAFRNLVERRLRTENPVSASAVDDVITSEILQLC